MNKYSIVALLHQATELCLEKPDLISNGFKRSGLFPWNVLAPDKSKLLPGSVFVTPTSPPPSTVAQPLLTQVESPLEDESIQFGVSPTQIVRPNLLPSLSSSHLLSSPLLSSPLLSSPLLRHSLIYSWTPLVRWSTLSNLPLSRTFSEV